MAGELEEVLGQRVIVAPAAWFEKAFLTTLARHTQTAPVRPVIDTAALCRAAGLVTPSGGHEPSLEAMARRMQLPVWTPHHALGDAMTTAELFLSLAERLEHEHPADVLTAVDLERLSRKHAQARL